jgi:2-keto-3-deoxy-L-rhamnonate aldolase RhmA
VNTASIRHALLRGEPCIGTWLQIGHPSAAEVLASLGFDWIAVDCEHTDIGLESLAAVLRAMHGRGPVPLVRVRENAVMAIRQPLDLGARGVIVPLVSTPDEARRAAAAARFPPEGVRGFAFCRGNEHGMGFAEYAAHANDDIAVVVMAETRLAVENIESIVAVDGVDGVFIGPYDLSGSYGVTGQTSHPLVLEAQRAIVAACRATGKAAGLHVVVPDPRGIRAALEAGFTFVAVGMDTVFLRDGGRAALDAARPNLT